MQKDFKQIFATATGFREKPFTSKSYKHWCETLPWPAPPKQALAETRDAALNGKNGKPSWSLAEVNRKYPLESPELKTKCEIYAWWLLGVPQYSTRHLHMQTGTKTRYEQWAKTKQIPELLSFQDYWFLSEYLRHTGHTVDVVSPETYEHPVQPGAYVAKRKRSRVGNTYGTWLVTGIASENEDCRPLHLKVMCTVCGAKHDRFNYSRVGHHCQNCHRLTLASKVKLSENLPTKSRKLAAPITLWELPDGWMVCPERPPNATGRVFLEELGVVVALERLVDSDKRLLVPDEAVPEVVETLRNPLEGLDVPDLFT